MQNRKPTRLKVLVTGGPTRAYLDRVRFLTNISTGALAYELCRKLCEAGMEVALVAGPTAQPFERLPLSHYLPVETNEEMLREVMRVCRGFRPDFAVFSAAVLDFSPVRRRVGKVSSREKEWTIRLRPTPKIIDEVGRKFPAVGRIGFKLEWAAGAAGRRRALARRLVAEKKLEGLCLNFLSELQTARAGTHPAYLASADGTVREARTKTEIAAWIARTIRRAGRNR